MEKVLANLEPKSVFHYFEEICTIPHGSFDTKRISDYCTDFAKKHHLNYYQDETNNVIIIKEASSGYESAKPVIIQGHLDMVCEKSENSNHDFKTDPLTLLIEDGWITADGTTLGGDDGIAIAYCFALLADNTLIHPKLYMVFTTEEEVGMEGAHAIDLTPVNDAGYMINLDSEDEGILLAGCAGGIRSNCTFPIERNPEKNLACEICVSGLHGGHSGQEINRFGANASVLLGTLLNDLDQTLTYSLESLNGGSKDNVIPRTATAIILIDPKDETLLKNRLEELQTVYQKNYASKDPNLTLNYKNLKNAEYQVFSKTSKEKAIFVLMQIPNGVQAMSLDIDGLVETSLNLGIMHSNDHDFLVSFAIRSSIGTAKETLCAKVKSFTEYLGGFYKEAAAYPAWEYRKDSKLREIMITVFEEMYHKTPKIEAIHAGLECGLISSKLPNLDIVSIGPDLVDIHTTEERMNIASTQRTWDYLLTVLKTLN
ncbi:MAG: aminoacyl-histidine dipeptidase [Eubacterium sp.]